MIKSVNGQIVSVVRNSTRPECSLHGMRALLSRLRPALTRTARGIAQRSSTWQGRNAGCKCELPELSAAFSPNIPSS